MPPAAIEALPDPPPSWLALTSATQNSEVWFLAGAALAALHPVAMDRRGAVPRALLTDRMAFVAAEACLRLMGRTERLADLRDAVHFLRPGEHPGPAGTVVLAWRRGLAQQESRSAHRPGLTPLSRAAAALAMGLADRPGDPVAALIAAEWALADTLGWPAPLPLIAPGIARRDLAARGEALELACARAVIATTPRVLALATELARAEARLRAVVPKLRSKATESAAALFLSTDAVAPTLTLSPVVRGTAVRMSERAARRLCERLAALGAVRELTGRPSFRLYGL
jgi:hypothetical protein